MSRNFQEHPDESMVIRFLDGELSEREAGELRSHLDGCWQCRRDLGEWQGTIDAFLRLRDTVLAAADPPPPNPWLPFDQLYPAGPAPERTHWWSFWKLAAVAATVLAAVLGATLLIRGPWRHDVAPGRPESKEPVPILQPGGAAAERKSSPETSVLPGKRSAPALPLPVGEAEADPAEARHRQVLVSQALHQLKADLGEPVEVIATATGAVVRDGGLEERRSREIRKAIEGVPGVQFAIRGGSVAGGAVAARAPQAAPQAPRPKLFAERILRELGSEAAVEAFANSILDDSDAVTVRAHAIEGLERLYPGRAGLTAADGRVIDGIVAEHRAALQAHAASMRARLQRWLPEGVAGGGDRKAALAARAIELDRLVNVAFAGARLEISDAELAARIESLLKELAP